MVKFSVHQLKDGSEVNSVKVTVAQLEDQQLLQHGKENAYFQMLRFQTVSLPSFVDYLREGWTV